MKRAKQTNMSRDMRFSNNVLCVTSKTSDQPAHTHSLIRVFASHSIRLLTELHLEFLSLKGGRLCSSESTLVKLPHCLKSHVTAHVHPSTSHYISHKSPFLLSFLDGIF